MTDAVVYMTGRATELRFDTVALAEKFLRSLGFEPCPDQPRQWVALFPLPRGNQFAELVDGAYLDDLLGRLEHRRR